MGCLIERHKEACWDSANLKATGKDPDSPRPPTAPTPAAALHSVHPTQSPGYHSNSDYWPPVVSHHIIINTCTQMASRGGCTHPCKYCTHTHTHTHPRRHAHSCSCVCMLSYMRNVKQMCTLTCSHKQSYLWFLELPNNFLFWVWATLPLSLNVQTLSSKNWSWWAASGEKTLERNHPNK